jgi:hypothetical protein
MKPTHILVADPSSHTKYGAPDNSGDLVIKGAIIKVLEKLDIDFAWVPYSHPIKSGEVLILGGANILGNPRATTASIWRPKLSSLLNSKVRINAVSVGCGWWGYEDMVNRWNSRIMKRYYSSQFPHSVRDGFTAQKFKEIGLLNVMNTGCPSMYQHTSFETNLPDTAVITVTYYRPNIFRDKIWIEKTLSRFNRIYLFAQGLEDIKYFEKVCALISGKQQKIEVIDRDIENLQMVINQTEAIHIGTRLHGNMFFLQNSLPSICLDVDNRTSEIKKSFNWLPIYELPEFLREIEKDTYKYKVNSKFDENFDLYLQLLKNSIDAT